MYVSRCRISAVAAVTSLSRDESKLCCWTNKTVNRRLGRRCSGTQRQRRAPKLTVKDKPIFFSSRSQKKTWWRSSSMARLPIISMLNHRHSRCTGPHSRCCQICTRLPSNMTCISFDVTVGPMNGYTNHWVIKKSRNMALCILRTTATDSGLTLILFLVRCTYLTVAASRCSTSWSLWNRVRLP